MVSRKSETPNLIVILDYNKSYMLKFFSSLKKKANLYFLFYSYNKETTGIHSDYGKAIYWKDFGNAFKLLDQITPKKVIFFELETLNQVALNVACRRKGIPTVFADHGLQDFNISIQANEFVRKKSNRLKTIIDKLKRISKNPYPVLKNRLFFQKTLLKLDKKHAQFLNSYKRIRLNNTITNTYLKINSSLLYPDSYLCFSPTNFEFHQKMNHNAQIPVKFIGIPELDPFFLYNSDTPVDFRKYVLFIDQPYVRYGYYGWDSDKKYKFLKDLKKDIENKGKLLLVKVHPRENTFWNNLNTEFSLITSDQLFENLNEISHAVGYNSTLLLPFIAFNQTMVYCLRNHPDTSISPFTKFVDYGVAVWYDELGDQSFMETKTQTDLFSKNKDRFIKEYLYLFDGKAKTRFDSAILDS
jgi:hypothetical protein